MMDELARLLGRERRLLELLLFKLVEGRHLLAASEARFLPSAVTEVERATDRVQEAELWRSMLIHDLARDLDMPEEALTMSALAENSIEPFRTIFADHRRAFLDLAAEIEEVTRQNRCLADVADGLATVGARTNQAESARATARITLPSLVDFLR